MPLLSHAVLVGGDGDGVVEHRATRRLGQVQGEGEVHVLGDRLPEDPQALLLVTVLSRGL